MGDTVAVQGIGGLGHLGIQFAAKAGYRVIAIGRGSENAALAKKLGAAVYIDSKATKPAEELQKLPVITRRANDILRAVRRDALPLSDPGVLKDLKKVLAGEKLSPVLVAEGDIADGYHRVSLAYALDPYADVPLKLG